jgi:hypothetical protein
MGKTVMTVVDGMAKAVGATVATDVFIGRQPSVMTEHLWHMPRRTDTHNSLFNGPINIFPVFIFMKCLKFIELRLSDVF